jgi:hypothetical protein
MDDDVNDDNDGNGLTEDDDIDDNGDGITDDELRSSIAVPVGADGLL